MDEDCVAPSAKLGAKQSTRAAEIKHAKAGSYYEVADLRSRLGEVRREGVIGVAREGFQTSDVTLCPWANGRDRRAEIEGLTPGVSNDARAAARGTLALFVLQSLGRVLGLGFVVGVARAVAPSELGRYSVVGGVVLFGGLLADFGTTTVVTRTVSRDRNEADRLLAGTLPASVALGVAAYVLCVAFAALSYPHEVVIDVAIGALSLPFSSALTSVLGALDGAGLITVRSTVTLLNTAIVTVGGAAAVLAGTSIRGPVIAFAVAPAVTLVVAGASARRAGIWRSRPGFDLARSRALLRAALPFAVLGGLSAVYRRFDLVVLSLVRPRAEVARYDLALRVVDAAGYLGSVVSAPALFLLSKRLGAGDREGAQRAFNTASRLVYLVGLPVSAGLIALHDPLIRLLFGPQYAGAAVLLGILGAQLWLEFIGALQGSLVVAGDRVGAALVLEAKVMALLTTLDVVLIARWGSVGAAIALASFQVVNVLAFRRFNASTAAITTPWPPFRAVLAAAACGAVAWLAGRVSVELGVASGVVTYAGLLAATGGINRGDFDVIRRVAGASPSGDEAGEHPVEPTS